MKRIILIIFSCFVCMNILYAQKTLCLQTRETIQGISRTVPVRDIKRTPNGVTVTYLLDSIILKNDPLYSNAITINIDGFWQNSSVGEPAVLSRWDTFAVPDLNARILVVDSSYVDFPMELSPARPILSNSGNEIHTKRNVLPIADYEGFFPSRVIPTTRFNNYRGQQLLEACITPIQYDFSKKIVRVFTMIKYEIQYNDLKLRNSLSKYYKATIKDNSFLHNIALNIPPTSSENCSKTSSNSSEIISNKYLIISVPKYISAVNRFAEWKRKTGFDVQISLNESWDTTMVKNVVYNAYVTDSIQYLLIIGGHNDVPGIIRNTRFNNSDHYHPTDLYYGCISNSYTPFVFRGRIPVNTYDESNLVIDKIINYEKKPVIDTTFYKTSIHCAYFQDYPTIDQNGHYCPPDGKEDRRFVLTSERIRDGMLCIIDSIKRVYYAEDTVNPLQWNDGNYANGDSIPPELMRPSFAWNGCSSQITDFINQKAFYVLMRDHGEEQKWLNPSYTLDDIDSLNNGNYLPIVFSICCNTGKFDVDSCFCEIFLKKTNGGCAAIFGASQKSLSGPNDVMVEGMFDAIWPILHLRPQFGIVDSTSYTPTPTPTFRLGQILDQGLKRIDEAYLNTNKDWYPRYTSELFHCFGDPSMMIYTQNPQNFQQPIITCHDGKIIVQTIEDDVRISFYTPSSNNVDSYIGNYVEYPTTADSVIICLDKHNYIPDIRTYYKNYYIQNETISEQHSYYGKSIYIGNHVTSEKPAGDVIIQNTDVTIEGDNIYLMPGTTIINSDVNINTGQ